MKGLIYEGPGRRSWATKPDPAIQDPTDAIVRVEASTICGTDLHILKGDVPEVTDGRILGHEAVGTVEAVGDGVHHGSSRTTASLVLVHHVVRHAAEFCREGHATANASVAEAGSSVT